MLTPSFVSLVKQRRVCLPHFKRGSGASSRISVSGFSSAPEARDQAARKGASHEGTQLGAEVDTRSGVDDEIRGVM